GRSKNCRPRPITTRPSSSSGCRRDWTRIPRSNVQTNGRPLPQARRMSFACIAPEGRLLVAVSGGPDSTALLVSLHEAGREIVAAHYDHALRDGSDSVAGQVPDLPAHLGVRLVTERRTQALAQASL